jgi:3-oxoacyl-[acyl-carrier protein] reductase
MNSRLKDKICIITGAASGIGLAASVRFVSEGGSVMMCDVNEAVLQDAVKEVSLKGDAKGFVTDVTNHENVHKMVSEVLKLYGRIDILINNAGITSDSTLLKMTEEQFDRVIDVNLKGTFNCTKEVAPAMVTAGRGKIINTASVVGIYGNFGQTNYAASKSGVIGMTKTWARELGRKNISVNAVAPGFILTEMTSKMPENILNMMKDKTPLNRLGLPEDVANVFLFLASGESDFINGAVISVDGGLVF